MIITHNNKKYLFVHIGGNSGTSVSWALWSLAHPNTEVPERHVDGSFEYIETMRDAGYMRDIGDQHRTYAEYCMAGEKFNHSFAIVRNPFDRMLAKFFASPQSKNVKSTNVRKKFTDFVHEIYSRRTPFAQEQYMHTICQSNYLFYFNKHVDYVLRFERLDNDFKAFCLATDLPDIKLIKCNATSHPLKRMDIYTREAALMVYLKNTRVIHKFYPEYKPKTIKIAKH